jgi:hypothetical protein
MPEQNQVAGNFLESWEHGREFVHPLKANASTRLHLLSDEFVIANQTQLAFFRSATSGCFAP